MKMNTAEKIKLGLTGGKAERGLLINDANKVVSNAVLKNPRITDGEIIMVVNSKTASDDVLRMVARNKEWVKNLNVKMGLIMNPKTPLPIALRFLDYIDKRALAKIAKSKNVSNVLSSNATRKMERIR
jgi:pentose-5-phosphate-3-epimerase